MFAQAAREAHQFEEIEVVHGDRVGLVADRERIAGQAQDVPGAQRPCPEQVGGDREPVPIPDGHLEGGLEAGPSR